MFVQDFVSGLACCMN